MKNQIKKVSVLSAFFLQLVCFSVMGTKSIGLESIDQNKTKTAKHKKMQPYNKANDVPFSNNNKPSNKRSNDDIDSNYVISPTDDNPYKLLNSTGLSNFEIKNKNSNINTRDLKYNENFKSFEQQKNNNTAMPKEQELPDTNLPYFGFLKSMPNKQKKPTSSSGSSVSAPSSNNSGGRTQDHKASVKQGKTKSIKKTIMPNKKS